jgi:hypothetical protein
VTLREKRCLFSRLFAQLILRAWTMGYQAAIDQVRRSKEEATRLGFSRSLHVKGLAGDLLLYRDGKYLRSTKAHEELGLWWEAQHELCCWGGRFGDGGHYSITHGGVK